MKNNIIKKIYILALLLTCVTTLTACLSTEARRKDVGERDKYELYLAHASQTDTVTDIFAMKFAELVEQKSKGTIKMNVYPNSQLGGDIEITEAVQRGNITFVVQTTAPQVPFVKEVAIFDAPMAFKNLKIARMVLDGQLQEELKKCYEKKHLRLLGYADQGYRVMSSNKEIKKISDLKGIKIRTMENSNHIALWTASGANPTPMAWAEVYVGLQQKTIDAQENPIETIVASKVYEQQNYVIQTNHILHTLSLVGSTAVLDDLPKDLQDIIQESADEAKVFARKQTDERSDGRIQILKDNDVVILDYNDELFSQMRDATKGVWTTIEKKIGKDLVDVLRKEIDRAEKETGVN